MRRVLKKSLRVSYDAGADGMALCTRDLIVICVNRACANFLGVSKQHILGKNVLALISVDSDFAQTHSLTHRNLVSGLQAKGVRIQTPTGTHTVVDFWIKPAEGDMMLIYFKKSRQSKYFFSNVYDFEKSIHKSRTEAIFLETFDHQAVFYNDAIIQMFGYAPNTQPSSFFSSAVFAQEGDRHKLLSLIISKGVLTDQRVLYKRSDHSNFWGILNCKLVEREGVMFFDGVIIDITDQLKREGLLRERADALEKANAELDRFIYSASHDIRAPISSMRGLLNLMLLEHDAGKYMQMLETSLNKLDNFVNELTLFSQNKRQRLVSEEINFPGVIQDVFEKMKNQTGFEFINVETEFRLDSIFFSDLFRIRLVLEQVIKNSYEFYDPGKSSPCVLVSVHVMGDKAVLEIFDNGAGIPKAHIGRVFDMFYRASNLTKGSGIGLYIAREAVTLLKGTISISSEYGVGTSLRIEVPNALKGKLIAKKQTLRSQRHSG